jgi:hypothetical protein
MSCEEIGQKRRHQDNPINATAGLENGAQLFLIGSHFKVELSRFAVTIY